MFANLNFKTPHFLKNLRLEEVKYLLQIGREKKALVVFMLGLILLSFVLVKIFISPQIEKARNYQKELAVIANKSDTLQQALIEHPEIEEEVALLKVRQRKLTQSFLPEREFLAVTQRVIAELENRGIKISGFKYLYDIEEPLQENFKKYGLQLEIITNYLKFSRFLEDSERQGVMFGIGRIKITKINEEILSIKLRMDFMTREEI